jgi:hypothetical protein
MPFCARSSARLRQAFGAAQDFGRSSSFFRADWELVTAYVKRGVREIYKVKTCTSRRKVVSHENFMAVKTSGKNKAQVFRL